VFLNENGFLSSPAKRFDANRASSRKKIKESRASYARPQHVEKRFAQAIAGGPESKTLKGLQDSAAVGSGDDAHECSY
jgi:hypothetical protein